MRLLNCTKIRIVLVGFVVAIAIGGGSAKADFTFGMPVNLGPTVNSSAYESGPSISGDDLSLYFRSARPGGYGNRDVWLASRATINDAWGEPVNLGSVVNSPYEEGGPSISSDGLTLYFYSNRPGGSGGNDIYVSTRETIDDPWSEAVNLGPTFNSSASDGGAHISADGLSLFFNSRRLGDNDVYVSTRATTDEPWGEPVNLGPVINSSADDRAPSISTDDLRLFLISRRPGGYGDHDLYVATRATRNDPWGEPTNLGPTVNSPALDAHPSISVDGRMLYFNSNRPGGIGDNDLWQVSIDPVVDLNGDGIVDAADMCIMVDHWGTDDPLCDIGPMPWGDGIVDVQDLIVLAEHLFEEVPPVEVEPTE
jgi:Tol biopolymer transport system component